MHRPLLNSYLQLLCCAALVSAVQVGLPIRALAIDPRHDCWAGDDAGIIYMLHAAGYATQIMLRKVEVPPASANLWRLSAARGSSSDYTPSSSSSSGPTAAPILALISKGPVVVSSGGHDRNYITLWNSQKCEMVEHCNTQTYGAAHALAILPWQDQHKQQQQQLPAGVAALAGFDGRAMLPAELFGWRLLSGHESGQVLLWKVQGLQARHGARAVQLLCIMLEPRQLR